MVVHAPHAGEKSAQMSWASPSPRPLLGSVVRIHMHVFAFALTTPAQPAALMAVTSEGHPPVGAMSSQFALIVTPVMPESAKAWTKCWAAAQKSGLPIWACHGKVVVPVIVVPVGQAVE